MARPLTPAARAELAARNVQIADSDLAGYLGHGFHVAARFCLERLNAAKEEAAAARAKLCRMEEARAAFAADHKARAAMARRPLFSL